MMLVKVNAPHKVGAQVPCIECGDPFLKTASTKVRCHPCQAANRQRQQEVKRAKHGATYNQSNSAKRELKLARPALSREIPCANCSRLFVRRSAFAKYCGDCRALGKWALLSPSQKQRRLDARRPVRRNRTVEDKTFALNKRMSSGVLHSLRTAKSGRSWESLVGYTIADLMRHLEAQFLKGMNWENRGEWHIDHIRPLCSFEFQTPECPQFREAWALTNLRPLWAADNIRKSGRRTLLL